jgi:hypothetical protein
MEDTNTSSTKVNLRPKDMELGKIKVIYPSGMCDTDLGHRVDNTGSFKVGDKIKLEGGKVMLSVKNSNANTGGGANASLIGGANG